MLPRFWEQEGGGSRGHGCSWRIGLRKGCSRHRASFTSPTTESKASLLVPVAYTGPGVSEGKAIKIADGYLDRKGLSLGLCLK